MKEACCTENMHSEERMWWDKKVFKGKDKEMKMGTDI
jgi:hypothetical protein